jgi:hypothetical protein
VTFGLRSILAAGSLALAFVRSDPPSIAGFRADASGRPPS